MSNVAKTLRKACELIEAKGLCRDGFENDLGQIDAFEAIWQAATGISQKEDQARGRIRGPQGVTLAEYNRFWYACLTLQRWLEEHDEPRQIPRWCDKYSQEEVIAEMLACARADEGD